MNEYRPKPSRGSSSRKAESRGTKDGDYTEGWESDKFESQHSNAFEYIQRSKGGVPIDSDRRPYTPWSSPTIHIETLHRDTARRSSARSRSARDFERPNSSGRERRGSFGVTESPLRSHSSRKIPSIPNATSAPAGLKIPSLKASHSTSIPRAATMLNNLHDKRDRPPVRRSETLPVPGMTSRRADRPSSRSSKLKELYDSGYSSPGTPEMNQGSPQNHPSTWSLTRMKTTREVTELFRSIQICHIVTRVHLRLDVTNRRCLPAQCRGHHVQEHPTCTEMLQCLVICHRATKHRDRFLPGHPLHYEVEQVEMPYLARLRLATSTKGFRMIKFDTHPRLVEKT